MKIRPYILMVLALVMASCSVSKQLGGTYSDGNRIVFKFDDSTGLFEYNLKGDMAILQHSRGKWKKDGRKLYIYGFENGVDSMAVESVVSKPLGNRTNVNVHLVGEATASYIASIIVVNDTLACLVRRDTLLILPYKAHSLQVKSYMAEKGAFSSLPKVDTLYSAKIDASKGGDVSLRFAVYANDFVRVRLVDTLTVKKGGVLRSKYMTLRKIAE